MYLVLLRLPRHMSTCRRTKRMWMGIRHRTPEHQRLAQVQASGSNPVFVCRQVGTYLLATELRGTLLSADPVKHACRVGRPLWHSRVAAWDYACITSYTKEVHAECQQRQTKVYVYAYRVGDAFLNTGFLVHCASGPCAARRSSSCRNALICCV